MVLFVNTICHQHSIMKSGFPVDIKVVNVESLSLKKKYIILNEQVFFLIINSLDEMKKGLF